MTKLPRKVLVKEVCNSRYCQTSSCKTSDLNSGQIGYRPESWDQRISGEDVVMVAAGDACSRQQNLPLEKIKLNSLGDQSVPAPGWVLMLTDGSETAGYSWTLYGFKKSCKKKCSSEHKENHHSTCH